MNITIDKLTLKNFKGIKELEINFNDITNIKGDNGSGKTTIFDAFTWLLFDKDSKDRKDFEIKTISTDGEVIHGLDHEVTGYLDLDGKKVKLTKTYKEKWTKKKREADKQFTGHETIYCIDDIPIKRSEYQNYISSIVDENIFKLITNPLYFNNSLKWQDRREVLMSIIGDIDAERVLNYNSKLKGLRKLLDDTNVETLKKSIQASKKRLNDEIKSIPFRIDELNNSIQDVDFSAIEFRLRGLKSGLKSIEDKLLDSSKANEDTLKQRQRLFDLKSQLQDIEHKFRQEAYKPLDQLKDKLNELTIKGRAAKSAVENLKEDISQINFNIQKLEQSLETLRTTFETESEKQLIMDLHEFACPTCKRAFEDSDIETKKAEMVANFNQSKSSKLAEINNTGKETKQKLEELSQAIATKNEELEAAQKELQSITDSYNAIKKQIDSFTVEDSCKDSKEYQELLSQIEQLQNLTTSSSDNDNSELKAKKSELEAEIAECNKQLALKDQNINFKARIGELMDKENELAQKIAELEGQEFLCEEFIKSKVELLESSINAKFKFVTFKLFDIQINGGLSETCEALIDGVPFGNANTASQINSGLDIINALSAYYQVQAPIFIDNRESVNEILECDSQVVNLIVSSDKKLIVESEAA